MGTGAAPQEALPGCRGFGHPKAMSALRARLIPRSIRRPIPSLTAYPRLASAFATLIGCLVIVGWAFDIGTLRTVLPGLVAMNPATAVSFIAGGLSLWLFDTGLADRRSRRLGTVLALAVVLIGLTKLIGIVTGWDLGLDQLLFHDKLVVAGTRLPNRMAPNTAVAFLSIGLALTFLYSEPHVDERIAQFFSLAATVVASLAFVGYVYGVPSLSGISSYIHMALNTAVTFVVLSIGVLFARAHTGIVAVITSDAPGGAMARSQLPIAIVVPVVLGWFRLKGQELRLYHTDAGVTIGAVYGIYLSVTLIWFGARAINRLDAGRKQAEEERVQLLVAQLVALARLDQTKSEPDPEVDRRQA